MKTTFSTITTLLFTFSLIAQNLSFKEDRTISFYRDYTFYIGSYLKSGVVLDKEDNKIIVGAYDGIDVNFGNANFISSKGHPNAYIAKYNQSDELLWLKNIGGTKDQSTTPRENVTLDFATDVAVDSNNNIYVLATIDVATTETVDFDPEHPNTNSIIKTNPSFSSSQRNLNVFLIKYSPNGKLLWYKEVQDIFNDASFKLLVDANDHVFFTGSFDGITGSFIDFDTSKDYPDDRDIIQNRFLRLGFIVQYDEDGNFINAYGIGGGTISDITMKTSSSKNRYASGSFSAAKTNTNEGLSLFKNSKKPAYVTSQGRFEFAPENQDIFIVKYLKSGEVLWTNTISSTSENRVSEMVIDKNENVYISGYINGASVDFDTNNSSTTDTRSASSGDRAFIAKYNALDGSLNWVKTIEGGNFSKIRDIAIQNDKIIVGGEFNGTIKMGTHKLTANVTNPFIAIIDTNGNWLSVGNMEKSSFSSVSDVIIAKDGTIHYLGFKAKSITDEQHIVENLFIGKVNNSVLSIDQLNSEIGTFNVSPNPTSNHINIEFKEQKPNVEIKIYNYLGQIMLSKKSSFVKKERIHINTLEKGIYFLQIEENGTITNSTKIIKE